MSAPIRAIISDLDGVVWRGEEPIPEAVETLRAWSGRGVPLAFVTNNSAHSAEDFAWRDVIGDVVDRTQDGVAGRDLDNQVAYGQDRFSHQDLLVC